VFPSFYDRLPSGEHIASYNTVAGVVANSGLSEVTVTPEAFMDTALVNGKAYPTLTVEPKAYRFKILNACK
jgi:FtsP/CotA-like multicopper oxidase with cupredoxin domain